MDLFGRKKPRLRQTSTDLTERSVPYDRLGPAARSPIPVGTVSNGLRTSASNAISAPTTNPTLTNDGTELNIYAMMRSKSERERLYPQSSSSKSPTMSTANSSATISSDQASSNNSFTTITDSGRLRRSEASSSGFPDSGSPSSNTSPRSTYHNAANAAARPMSVASSRSESNRASKYAHSLTTSESLQSHYSHMMSKADDFEFERPSDENVEALFHEVREKRNLGELPNLTVDQKWQIVYNDEQLRWKEEKVRDQATRKVMDAGSGSAAFVKDSPEWYLKKFLDQTITPKQAAGLLVSLRTGTMGWFKQFLDIQGTSVLANTLNNISRKGVNRRETDFALEYEILKCLRHILNVESGASEALVHPLIVQHIASTLNTSQISSRKVALEILTFLCYWKDGAHHELVISALEALSASNNEKSPYGYWFRSLENTLSGRGKMGSLVGASDEVRRNGGLDSSLNDYAQANLLVIHGVLDHIDDLDLRMHHRSMMDAAGLRRIMDICYEFGYPQIERQLSLIEKLIEADERALRELMDEKILKDFGNPEDVYKALLAKTQDTKAHDYFLSTMQHLLFIHEDGPALEHYYQLIDSTVTDIVMDRHLGNAELRLGTSVSRVIAQLNEAERFHTVEEQANEAKARALQLKLEKEQLEEEISCGADGLVGKLKEKVSHLEEKLKGSRGTIELLQGRLEEQRRGYEEQITQLEAQIMELFRMLKELGKGVDEIVEQGQAMDRKELIQTLGKQLERNKTISMLEGRRNSRGRTAVPGDEDGFHDDDDDDDDESVRPSGSSRSLKRGSKVVGKDRKHHVKNQQSTHLRDSQFADADELSVQEHIEERIAAGDHMYPRREGTMSSPRNVRGTPLRNGHSRLALEFDLSPQANGQPSRLFPADGDGSRKRDSRNSSDEKDSESEYRQSTRSAASTVDTQATSIHSQKSTDGNNLGQPAVNGQLSLAQALANKMAGIHRPSPIPDGSQGIPPPPPPPPPQPMSGGSFASLPPPPPPPPPPPLNGFLSSSTYGIPPAPPPPPPSASNPPSAPGSARPSMYLGMNLNNLVMARKDISITPNTKMKQLQWDKLPQTQVGKTLWNDEEPTKEKEWIDKLREQRIWEEMEEDFKAKQLVINLMAKQKKAELRSVLDPQTRKRVEILMNRVKSLQPEEIADKIERFDRDLCTETFLGELKNLLPNPEQVGKLNIYRNADAQELAGLHTADRLMVKLIQIDRLAPRIEAMLYKRTFDETWKLLSESSKKLIEAGENLLNASNFKELLSLILLIGNYMNGTGVKGGAFGFRVSSINKLVDTKSLNNTTLLHFLEKTVSNHFPEMATFLDELEKPAEAYRVNLLEMRKGYAELREGLKNIKKELDEHFSDADLSSPFVSQMWSFVGKAGDNLEDLQDDLNISDTKFTQAVSYYGEEDRGMTSSEFYGIFKTFVTSYRKCQFDNRSLQEEKESAEKRRKAAEEAKANRSMRAAEDNTGAEDNAILDTILEKLRNGDSVGRKGRKGRRGKSGMPAPMPEAIAENPATSTELPPISEVGDKTVDLARDMLAALKSDGFETFSNSSSTPRPARSSRRNRQRLRAFSEFGESSPMSPTFSTLSDGRDLSDVEGDLFGSRHTLSRDSIALSDEIESIDTSQDNPDATIRGR